MSSIIAGRFETQAQADRAVEALRGAGFEPQEVSSFYLNPAGQHASYPIGGDAHHDEGRRSPEKLQRRAAPAFLRATRSTR